ncbi:MAG: S8 family serine peptidase [Proteobacteria bacterium]|nr:S8 family serine peptidase [Pseudomonadota bacterium]
MKCSSMWGSLVLLAGAVSACSAESDQHEAQGIGVVRGGLRADHTQARVSGPSGAGLAQQYIVMLRPRAKLGPLAQRFNLAPTRVYKRLLNGFVVSLPEPVARVLERFPDVVSLTPVQRAYAHGFAAASDEVPTGVARIGGYTSTQTDVGIAILDTGVDMNQPELNLVSSVDCVGQASTATCLEGGDDVYGHGTHVASTAAARLDDSGVVGVAPGAPVYSIKVLGDDGAGNTADIITGLEWVAEHAASENIRVANMSLGGGCWFWFWQVPCDDQPCATTTDAYHKAVCNLVEDHGVTLVVSAGNSSMDARYFAPAAFDEVLTLSAHTDFDGMPGGEGTGSYGFGTCTESVDDSLACFSNYGADIDFTAPGVGILSTTPYGLQAWSGTSMAAPHVAGAAAAYIQEKLDLGQSLPTPAQVQEGLLSNAELSPCAGSEGACLDDPDGIADPMVHMESSLPPGCETDADCNDADMCNGDETCIDGACAPGKPLLCDDGDACNGTETCDPGMGCNPGQAPICDDGNPCNGVEMCDPSSGCTTGHPMDCNDGDACNGTETCDPGMGCVSGTPLTCNDGNACNGVETCDPGTGCVAGTPMLCDDGDACNGVETCSNGACEPGQPLNCNDGNDCTMDSCGAGICQHTFLPEGASCETGGTCDEAGECD